MDVRMELARILITEFGDQQVIYLREKGGERTFPIVIGLPEALAIDRRLKNLPVQRPMTHDLMASIIEVMGGRLEKIVINDLRKLGPEEFGQTFIATIHIRRGKELIPIDSRPSDAIALGVAFNTPIYVAQHVLEEATKEATSKEDRVELLRNRLEVLQARIQKVSQRLADQEFLAQASEAVVEEHRRVLNEMKTEYEAIDRVLKKLG